MAEKKQEYEVVGTVTLELRRLKKLRLAMHTDYVTAKLAGGIEGVVSADFPVPLIFCFKKPGEKQIVLDLGSSLQEIFRTIGWVPEPNIEEPKA